MSSDDPDFKKFACAWVDKDPRVAAHLREHPEDADGLVAKLALGLERRRHEVSKEADSGNLVVSVDPSRFGGPEGLDSQAWDSLARWVGEHHDHLQESS